MLNILKIRNRLTSTNIKLISLTLMVSFVLCCHGIPDGPPSGGSDSIDNAETSIR